MANIKFSDFSLTAYGTIDDFLVGYNSATNLNNRIAFQDVQQTFVTGTVIEFSYLGTLSIGAGITSITYEWNNTVLQKTSYYDVAMIPYISGASNEFLTFDTPAFNRVWRIDFEISGVLSDQDWIRIYIQALDNSSNAIATVFDDWFSLPVDGITSGGPPQYPIYINSVFPFTKRGSFLFTPDSINNAVKLTGFFGISGRGVQSFTVGSNNIKLTATLIV